MCKHCEKYQDDLDMDLTLTGLHSKEGSYDKYLTYPNSLNRLNMNAVNMLIKSDVIQKERLPSSIYCI